MNGCRPRRGLGLIELVAVIAILGLVAGMMGSTIVSQQRFHRHAATVLGARQGVRDAMEVLSTDIRGASIDDTVRVMADSALELFAGIGISVACRTLSGNSISLASESPTGSTLTSFLLNPDTGDIALIYRKDSIDADAGLWERHRIDAVTTKAGGRGCLGEDIDPAEGFVLTVRSPLGRIVERGTPVRFVRRGRYSLYRSSDSRWYLGYRRCNAIGASACGAIQPISGPYRRYNANKAETGFLFEYYDSGGDLLTSAASPLSIARVDITARADSDRPREESSGGVPPEFASTSIAIRNR
jgi:prepilin-type N-terminal cleavage/methylation domain-containing protein